MKKTIRKDYQLFKTDLGKSIVVVNGKLTNDEALKIANGYFKSSRAALEPRIAYLFKDELYFQNPHKQKARLVWAISRR